MAVISLVSICVQGVQSKLCGTALVLCQVHLLRSVSLSDPLRIPHKNPGQLPHQEIQPSQPVSVPRVIPQCEVDCCHHDVLKRKDLKFENVLLKTPYIKDIIPWVFKVDVANSFCRFRLVPFLVELRAVMDWVWTDTTLSLSNWMCVEDIYANIFIIKCSRETEKVLEKPSAKLLLKYHM